MRKHWATGTIMAVGAAAWMLTGALAAETTSGKWAMHRSNTPGMVQFSLQSSRDTQGFTSLSNWPTSTFSGLDLEKDTQFTLTRDAGTFEFEGTLRDGAGAGLYQFSANPSYAQEMKALGFGGVAGKQIHFAMHDVSLKFARDMKNENLQGLDADQLLAFRIHGVTLAMVQRVRGAGYTPDASMLVAMRIHGATPEYMDDLKQRGYAGVPLDQLVAFRIHGVTPDFIGELQRLGFERPQPEQLVNLRIHGVTPEYISQMQARGVKDLTIDKLVAMKIHGLD
jgi:hypothetical protein